MKVRVIETKGGIYKSQYYCENRNLGWTGTYRNNNCITQNEFNTLEQAIEECKWFAENKSEGKTVYEADL